MKKLNLLIVLLLSFLFIGCEYQVAKPSLCHIIIEDNPNCTYTLEKSEVIMGSFCKITVVPTPGYYISGFYIHDEQRGNSYNRAKYYKSEEEENTYFILVTSAKSIKIQTAECDKYYIEKYPNTKHFTLSSPYKTFAGDTVTFTIIPDECFYLDPTTVEVRKMLSYYNNDEFEKLSLTQSQTNPNEFSFIMPDKKVMIYAEIKFAITVSPRKASFKEGEAIIFDITNHNPDDAFDIQISDGYTSTEKSDYKTIEKGKKLSQTYELPYTFIGEKYSETETGNYTLHIYPKDSNYYTGTEATANFVINLVDMPEGWTTIGIKTWATVFPKNSSGGFVVFNLSNIDIPNDTSLKFKYSLENDNPSDTIEGTINTLFYKYNKSCTLYRSDISKTIDLTPFTKIVVWIEDDDLKFISRKVSLFLD